MTGKKNELTDNVSFAMVDQFKNEKKELFVIWGSYDGKLCMKMIK